MTNTATAQTIWDQLGADKFKMMTGSTRHHADDKSLIITLKKNKLKARWLKITLEDSDTYTLEFMFMAVTADEDGFLTLKTLATYTDVYGEMLHDIFTLATGLDCTLD